MQKWWSVLFGVVAFACVASFAVAPFFDWWLPKNVSSFGPKVDTLFYFILWITAFFFLLTEGLLVYFLYTYAGGPAGHVHPVGHHYAEKRVLWTSFFKRIAKPVTAVIHNQHRLELFWTFVPGVILLIIAIVQVNTWAEIKYQSRMPAPDDKTLQMEVNARQFEWHVRYPNLARRQSWKKDPKLAASFGSEVQADDLHLVNEVHCYQRQKVLVTLTSRDVLHSFYFPNLRLKQDAVPGKVIPVWFEARTGDDTTDAKDYNTRRVDQYTEDLHSPRENRPWVLYDDKKTDQGYHWVRWADGYDPNTNEFNKQAQVWELLCAELCGWGHYKMQGRLYVHQNEDDYNDWLQAAEKEQHRTRPPE